MYQHSTFPSFLYIMLQLTVVNLSVQNHYLWDVVVNISLSHHVAVLSTVRPVGGTPSGACSGSNVLTIPSATEGMERILMRREKEPGS
jgi:hypothetical protein